MLGSVVSVIFNILLTSLFVFGLKWGAFSIAIATSLSAWFNYFYLSYHLSKKIGGPLFDSAVFRSFLRTGASALIAAIATILVGKFFVDDPTLKILSGETVLLFRRDFTMQFMQFASLSGTFVLIFFSYAWLFNAEDVLELIGVKRKSVTASDV
jgi:putative peptidoglycan lipid II flippase